MKRATSKPCVHGTGPCGCRKTNYTMKNIVFVFLWMAVWAGCQPATSPGLEQALQRAGQNRAELEKALGHFRGERQQAMRFLVEYMPESDLKTLHADFLIENVDVAYLTRDSLAWTAGLDQSVFFNEVLPYACLNEHRDNWRADFYNRFMQYVKTASTAEEAIWQVNHNILKELQVEYNTGRKKPDQSPYESMEIGMASCSGLSILLVDAFRAVGIPARIAGTPNWFNNSGNHNWVEVYVNGNWHFTEYYPSGTFDEAWFLERAGMADVQNPNQWMYASSYRNTGLSFPLVWDSSRTDVHALNVTDRYIQLAQAAGDAEVQSVRLQIALLKDRACSISGNNRERTEVTLYQNGEAIQSGFTSGQTDDMNRFLTFSIAKNQKYILQYQTPEGKLQALELVSVASDSLVVLPH